MSGILAMMGAARPSPVTITDKTCFKGVTDPADATATYTLDTDRLAKKNSSITLEQWLDSSYSPGDFEVRATLNSGDTPSGNLGTWNNLGTARSWALAETTVGTLSCSLLIEIGYSGQNVALDSATITITAVVA